MAEIDVDALIERLESKNYGEMSEFADGWEKAIAFAIEEVQKAAEPPEEEDWRSEAIHLGI